MSIFKRGRVYWFHFVFEGRHVQRSTKQSNLRTARQIEAAYRTALAKGEVGITERKRIPTFKEAMKAFLEWSRSEHRTHPATHRRYQVSSAALLRGFGDAPLDKITPDDVQRFKAQRSAEKSSRTKRMIKPATVNRELACLKVMFNHAIKADVPVRNPVSRVRLFDEQNEQTRLVTFQEQERYLAASSSTLRDVATLMLETGMRPEEVYRIRAENISLREGFLFNPHGKTKAAKRRVPLTSSATAV